MSLCCVFRVENQRGQGGWRVKWHHPLFLALLWRRALCAHPTPEIHFLTPNKINTLLAPYYLLESVFWQNLSLERMDAPSSQPEIRSAPKSLLSVHISELLRWKVLHIRTCLHLSVSVSFFFQGVFSNLGQSIWGGDSSGKTTVAAYK